MEENPVAVGKRVVVVVVLGAVSLALPAIVAFASMSAALELAVLAVAVAAVESVIAAVIAE